ncbi:hypothetical protein EMIHUDRAFT_228465 [Emiliania huxleyi CCMP1516]|uniref:Uncharacterized protein n=2 Tax=Emiliania huxleyi TaxID=2903 RepID=A0A0D3KFZ2_EMIH1|nr:hypothetical protein EMIHUDRAFT_228465 [Emiliania huxleyi CCMP1516]EOD34677.1 hypothetical protein EMIHUDRAFT_228465 [Emiliania huxleyi CCMP1516]|eukprot:XP_005787106.1 hypothetical protein EMIHUDRAFT_228465 [Emiliania huxleyi CCMP1516]
MGGALAALSPCSWDLMPRHLCGRSILSDGASPPAAPSLFGSCAASWAAWRGGRLSLPPPRVSLVSLFVYSSLASSAASWAAWRGGRPSLPPPRVSLVSLFVYSSLVSCAASWAAWRGGRLSLLPP